MYPASTEVLVIGGGPAGSTAATLLARSGFQVTLVERDVFPRYHIGESLLPTALDFLDMLGARHKIEQFGFTRKPGAHIEWGNQQWDLIFGELSGNQGYSYQVTRAEFDKMLLDHAEEEGVQVFQKTEVRELTFDPNEPARPVAAVVAPRDNRAATTTITFNHVIDASGRNGIMASKYLRNRYYHDVFKNIGVWGYWKNFRHFPDKKRGAIAVVAVPYGWIWGIPLHDGTISVGIVSHKDTFTAKVTDREDVPTAAARHEFYMDALGQSETILNILDGAEMVGELHTETDYSYAANSFCGPGYFMAGDAACFLDPLLSTGVHLAMLAGMLSAASLSSLRAGEITEAEALEFYDTSYRYAYLRYLTFVSSFYNAYDGKDNIFWMARQLSSHDVPSGMLKDAFTSLVSGREDLRDLQEMGDETRVQIAELMSQRVKENLDLRHDKSALQAALEEGSETAHENHRFFSKVEGISILCPDDAVQGFYVQTQPKLRLVRISEGMRAAAAD